MHQEQGGLPVPVSQRGQDVVEYGIIVATIALVVLVGVITFGNQIGPWASKIIAVGT
jgi:Flp pilus assembly pilin Flp